MRQSLLAGWSAAALCLAATACSPSDQARVHQDARAADHDLADAARSVKDDPDIRQAGDDAKKAAHDAAVALRKGAAEAEVKGGQALIDAGDKTKRAARDARADADNH